MFCVRPYVKTCPTIDASLAKRFVLQTTMLATDFAFLTSFVSELFLTATMAHKMTKKQK